MKHISSVVKVGALTVKRSTLITAAAALSMAGLAPFVASNMASAGSITGRSLAVSSTVARDDNANPAGGTYTYGANVANGEVPAGDPRNGTKVSHTYTFTVPTAGDIQGFSFEYCQAAFDYVGAGACTATQLLNSGTGFSTAAWSTKTVSIKGETFTASNLVGGSPANNTLTLTAANPISVTANEQLTITFTATETDFFVNPHSSYKSTANGTYFAHIKTYATSGAATSGIENDAGHVDEGTVTNNITTAITLYTRVQETLNFSVEGDDWSVPNTTRAGATPANTGGATCAPLTKPGNLKIGDSNSALATGQAYDAYSYFRLATNSSSGATVAYSGRTLTSGAGDEITAVPAQAVSAQDTEQFGLGFDTTDPLSGHDLAVGGLVMSGDYDAAGGTITGSPATAQIMFNDASDVTPEVIATSTGVVECSTGAIRYVVNIDSNTPAGIYTTKINYIATPSY